MASGPTSEIKVPALGESIREATVARWLKTAGNSVKADEVLVELETDKVTLEVIAPATGTLSEVRKQTGSIVVVGDVLGIVTHGEVAAQETKPQFTKPSPPQAPKTETKGNPFKLSGFKSMMGSLNQPAPQKSASPPPPPPPPTPTPEPSEGFSPSVRKLAEELAVNPREITGTGKGGRVTKADLLNLDEEKKFILDEPVPSQNVLRVSDRREERVKMSRLRQRIAERLKQAQNTAAILTTFNEVDMSAINDLRAEYKVSFEEKHGVRLGMMSFFVKACVQALKDFPAVNSEIEGDEIIYKNYYDIGVAVSMPQGLVVPVVRNADLLTFAELETEIAALANKAREGKLSIEEMTGGTFTITNGGVFGSLIATPILNPPQTAILGMHKIEDRPVVVNKEIVIRPMMYVALSYDHRVIDGRESVSFLVKVKEHLEKPELLLLDM
jgi:2-oxoglutarate dehydrogenase E2 component (dihydrolipoamide succinyltransferase)